MNNLLSVLISSIKAKITSLVSRVRYWTSINFIKAVILTKVRNALSHIFEIKPRDKNDYYPLFGYLVSKRLARAIIVVVGILCLCYFVWVNPIVNIVDGMESGEKIYSYNSLPLRFIKGNVKIKAKSGYIAYEGNVEDGYVAGYGRLYDADGGMIYKGNFERNQYSGQGTLYYPVGQTQYEGEFKGNVFEGVGTLYRENGTRKYSGQFSNGLFEGEGTLYNASELEVFKGNFHNGELVYTQLLGKSSSQIAELYTGNSRIYQKDSEWAVVMEDIDAFYVAAAEENSLENEINTSAIYVGKEEFVYGDQRMTTIDELCEVLGEPVFEGNSYVTFPEAVGINWLEKKGKSIPVECTLETQPVFDEMWSVESYSTDTLIYLYVFQVEDVTYTFIADDRNGKFFMYALEQ